MSSETRNAPKKLGRDDKSRKRKIDTVAPAAPKKSIAVLPFENLSEDKANDYFADGIQEEILTRLSRIARSESDFTHFDSALQEHERERLPEIAKQLGVANILEGSVRKAGDKVRVHVQLIDAENDAHLWAERYDRQLDDIFAVESDIAGENRGSVAGEIRPARNDAPLRRGRRKTLKRMSCI